MTYIVYYDEVLEDTTRKEIEVTDNLDQVDDLSMKNGVNDNLHEKVGFVHYFDDKNVDIIL